jgi:hypothetical protein
MERLNNSDLQQQLSGEQYEKVRTHLEKMLVSAPFIHSQRSRSFLKYVVEEHLDGRCSQIKERNIAVDVFGKSENFDPQEESIVRVAAGDVRKRLSLAYQYDFGDGIQIELPVGSYCPHFNIVPLNLQPSADPPVTLIPGQKPKYKYLIWLSILGSLAGLFVAAISFALLRIEQPINQVWNSFSGYKQPVLLVLPTPLVLEAKYPEKWSSAQSNQPLAFDEFKPRGGSYTGIGASLGAARFAEQLTKRNQQFTLRFGKNTSYPDIQQAPSILLGGSSSHIGMQMTSTLRFRVVDEPQTSQIVDSQDSTPHSWIIQKNLPSGKEQEGYALITMIRKTDSGFPILIVAGLGPADTQAGVQFITDDDALRNFSRLGKTNWANRNFQIVLHEWIYEGFPDKSSIVSWNIW